LNVLIAEFIKELPEDKDSATRKARYNLNRTPADWPLSPNDKLLPGSKMVITKKTDGEKLMKHSYIDFTYKCIVASGPKKGELCG
jgi:hypothetical protein